MKTKQHLRFHKRGFTLVEVVTALVILSILAFFVAPEVMNWRPNMRLTDTAQGLYANMQSAKVAAVESNARVVVQFDLPNNQYRFFVDDGAGGAGANNDSFDAGEEVLSVDNEKAIILAVGDADYLTDHGMIPLPADVVFDAVSDFNGSTTPGFTSRGMPLAGRTGEIQLRLSDSSRWYRIQLKNAGGLGMQRKTSASAPWE